MSRLLQLDRPTRRAREVNWGDKTRISGNERKTLAWVSIEESGPMMVYAAATLRGPSGGTATLVTIEWGHGGASVDQEYPVIHRLRVPVAASMVKVSGRLALENGKPPPSTVSADIAVVIAPGSDGETLRNTDWFAGVGADGTLVASPARVLRFEGYNGGAKDTWAMFFDGPANNGDVPTAARPVRIGRAFTLERFDSQGFRRSVTWSASSTPMVLTKDPGALLRVEAEILL